MDLPGANGSFRSQSFGDDLDRICDSFESAWQRNQPPKIDEALSQVPQARQSAVLAELLHLDIAYRQRRGERPSAREYRQSLPAHSALVQKIFNDALGATEAHSVAPTVS